MHDNAIYNLWWTRVACISEKRGPPCSLPTPPESPRSEPVRRSYRRCNFGRGNPGEGIAGFGARAEKLSPVRVHVMSKMVGSIAGEEFSAGADAAC